MDNTSVCSDDTDLLLSTSCNLKDIQGSYISKNPDKYSLTEKYVNENLTGAVTLPGSLWGKSQNYDSSKSRFTLFKDINRKAFIPIISHIENPNTPGTDGITAGIHQGSSFKTSPNSKSLLSNSIGNNAEVGISSQANNASWRDDKFSTVTSIISGHHVRPTRPTSIIKNYVGSPKALNGGFSYNFDTPKSVKFEDSIIGVEDGSNNEKHFQTSYQELCLESDQNVYGVSGGEKKKDDEFEIIDEKVKEGKEILKRLLNSTEAKKPSVLKTFAKTQHNRCVTGNSTSDTFSDQKEVDLIKHDQELTNEFRADSPINSKDLKDPIFMSTRLDSDEKPAIISQDETSLITKGTKEQEDIQNKHLVAEVKELKEELSRYQVNSFLEIKSLKEDNDKMVTKLHGQLTNVSKQKETLEDYVNQLKGSLSKKSERCSELQEQLHSKLTIIHQMSTTENEDRCNFENQVNGLQERKKTLEEQIEKMETSFQEQYKEIRELERRFRSEKQSNTDVLANKDKDIAYLHQQIESISRENNTKEVELKSEMEMQVERALLRGKSLTQSQVNEMKLSLDSEFERHLRLESKHQAEVRNLKANFQTLKTINAKLKKELDRCLEENRKLEKNNLENMKKVREEDELEADLLKKKIIGYEKIQRSMALELIEESTKLAVVCGTSPSTSRMSSQDAYVDCNVMSEAMSVFKEHLEAFRHHVLSLTQDKQRQKSETNGENALPSINVQTSAKLLRHLQNRVQQLRKENAMLREHSMCESCQGEINSIIVIDTVGNNSVDKQCNPAENDSKSTKQLEDASPPLGHRVNVSGSPAKNKLPSNEIINTSVDRNITNMNAVDEQIEL